MLVRNTTPYKFLVKNRISFKFKVITMTYVNVHVMTTYNGCQGFLDFCVVSLVSIDDEKFV